MIVLSLKSRLIATNDSTHERPTKAQDPDLAFLGVAASLVGSLIPSLILASHDSNDGNGFVCESTLARP